MSRYFIAGSKGNFDRPNLYCIEWINDFVIPILHFNDGSVKTGICNQIYSVKNVIDNVRMGLWVELTREELCENLTKMNTKYYIHSNGFSLPDEPDMFCVEYDWLNKKVYNWLKTGERKLASNRVVNDYVKKCIIHYVDQQLWFDLSKDELDKKLAEFKKEAERKAEEDKPRYFINIKGGFNDHNGVSVLALEINTYTQENYIIFKDSRYTKERVFCTRSINDINICILNGDWVELSKEEIDTLQNEYKRDQINAQLKAEESSARYFIHKEKFTGQEDLYCIELNYKNNTRHNWSYDGGRVLCGKAFPNTSYVRDFLKNGTWIEVNKAWLEQQLNKFAQEAMQALENAKFTGTHYYIHKKKFVNNIYAVEINWDILNWWDWFEDGNRIEIEARNINNAKNYINDGDWIEISKETLYRKIAEYKLKQEEKEDERKAKEDKPRYFIHTKGFVNEKMLAVEVNTYTQENRCIYKNNKREKTEITYSFDELSRFIKSGVWREITKEELDNLLAKENVSITPKYMYVTGKMTDADHKNHLLNMYYSGENCVHYHFYNVLNSNKYSYLHDCCKYPTFVIYNSPLHNRWTVNDNMRKPKMYLTQLEAEHDITHTLNLKHDGFADIHQVVIYRVRVDNNNEIIGALEEVKKLY